MAQTALQELIEWMQEVDAPSGIIKKAQSLLPKERQIIEDAHTAGVVDGDFSTGFTGSDYFTQNFNH
jgi:hypothetical protein